LREDIEQYRKYLADKSVSLNEDVRLKEKQENEAKMEARKKERKSRHEPEEKVYELTLKQTLLPGLPPPVARTNETAKADADKPATGDEADDETDVEEKTPAIDAALKESKRILLDLISLSSRETVVAGTN
jgi:hypothetical protein